MAELQLQLSVSGEFQVTGSITEPHPQAPNGLGVLFETGSHCVALAGQDLATLLHYDYKCDISHSTLHASALYQSLASLGPSLDSIPLSLPL